MPDGIYGELAVTTLTRKGMPMIRYRSGDIARFLPGKCPCGSVLKRLDEVPGRFKEEKVLCYPMERWDDFLFSIDGLVDYQLEIEEEHWNLQVYLIGKSAVQAEKEILESLEKNDIKVQDVNKQIHCIELTEELPPYEGKRRIRRISSSPTME